MNPARTEKRKRILIGLAGTIFMLCIASALGNASDPNYQRTERTGQYVFPRIAQQMDRAKIIRVKLGDTSYTLKRTEPGGPDWVMIEAGNYPVRSDRLAALAEGLLNLQWGDARTKDPEKFDRIGLSDPSEGGNGAFLEILDQEDNSISSLITGRREDRLYARFPDENKAFRADGNLPPFYTREAWLDFDIVDMLPEVVGAVRITDSRQRGIYLTRAPGTGVRSFRPAPPYQNDRLISRLAASGPALALSRLAPIDVKPAASLESRPVGRHITSTHDGLEVDVSAYREPDGFFITLHAVEAGEGARRARTINKKADGWAYKLTEFDWNDFTPSVRSLVIRGETTTVATP